MSDTPRTDKEIVGESLVFASFARKLERELAAVIEQRDRLAEALQSIAALYESKEMTATVDQRIGDAYDMRCMARAALAAVKGGSHE